MVNITEDPAPQAQLPQADVLLVTATQAEATAVLDAFQGTLGGNLGRCFIGGKTYYDLGVIAGARTFMVQSEMGVSESLLTIREAFQVLSPSAVIMVGIAFGVDSERQQIGDILVSRQLLVYELQRIGRNPVEQSAITVRGDRVQASRRLLDKFQSKLTGWQETEVHFGLILSGTKLIDGRGFKDQLLQVEPEAIGGEMEGAGLYTVARRYKTDWILVKAICDWADGHKNENKGQLQKKAAQNAARFTLHVLQQGGFIEDKADPPFFSMSSQRLNASNMLGTTLRTYDSHSNWVVTIAWEPHGNRIASAGGDGTVQIWDASTGLTLLTFRHDAKFLSKAGLPPYVYAVAWSPSGQYIASAGAGRRVYVWDANTGEVVSSYQGHTGLLSSIYAIAWSPDSTRIVSACSSTGLDKTVHVWDANTGETLVRYNTYLDQVLNFSVLAVAWSPDGTRIASTCNDKITYVWSVTTGDLILTHRSHSNWVSDIAWSPDGKYLAIATSDGIVQVWNALTGDDILAYYRHTDNVRALAWSPDGTRIASASNDKTIQIWEPMTGKNIFTYSKHFGWTTDVAWSPNGTLIASASNDKTVHIWQAK